MFVDPKKPKYFNWSSSQSWLIYTISVMNSLVCGLLLFFIFKQVLIALLGGHFLLIVQLSLVISYLYLHSKDRDRQ